MKKILHYILASISILSLISLAFAYLSIYISPAKIWFLAFFGIAYPVIFLVNLAFAIYWAIRKRKILLITTAAMIILGVSYITDYLQIFPGSTNTKEQRKELTVMSYNVKLFDLYNWNNNINTRDEIFELIKSVNADVICFQEFYKENTSNFKTLDTLIKFQNARYYHEEYTRVNRDKYFFGIITFSKYPIVNKDIIRFENSDNICIYSDIKIADDTIRVFNTHLESIRFDHQDYCFMDSIKLDIDKQEIEGMKTILKRLKYAFIQRANQAEKVAETVADTPYPIIVCGDLNDTPVSYAYHTIKGKLSDSFKEAGFGLSTTYNGKFPSYRIDYVFHSDAFEVLSYRVIRKELSDHYPVVVKLFQ